MKSITPPRAVTTLLVAAAIGASQLYAQVSRNLSPGTSAPRSGSLTDDVTTEARLSNTEATRSSHNSGTPASARPVSVDLLRHPIRDKARRMLQRALAAMNAGNHESAIGQLRETLAKYPDSAAYVHSFLGVEYVKTQQFQNAVNSFQEAASFLPHDAMTHYNLGLSLACARDYDRAEEETRRALELDPTIEDAHVLMSVLEQRKAEPN